MAQKRYLPLWNVGKFFVFPAFFILPGLVTTYLYKWRIVKPDSTNLFGAFFVMGVVLLYGVGVSITCNYLLLFIPFTIYRKVNKKKILFLHLLFLAVFAVILFFVGISPFEFVTNKVLDTVVP